MEQGDERKLFMSAGTSRSVTDTETQPHCLRSLVIMHVHLFVYTVNIFYLQMWNLQICLLLKFVGDPKPARAALSVTPDVCRCLGGAGRSEGTDSHQLHPFPARTLGSNSWTHL